MLVKPRVALITVLYQSEKHLEAYLEALDQLSYPSDLLEVYLVDNSNQAKVAQIINSRQTKFSVKYLPSPQNLGFAGGNNLVFQELAGSDQIDYYFLLNQDTQIDPDCLSILVSAAETLPEAGMLEAKQLPNSHPKYVQPETNLTSWCSGGGVLLRKQAVDQVGYFDQQFYLYSEDVDLSWRMWLAGWQCQLIPDATYYHQTEELDPDKDQSIRHYYSFRNIQLINILYNSLFGGLRFYLLAWASLFLKKPEYFWVRLKAILAAHLLLPAYFFKRCQRHFLVKHPWINFTRLSFGLKKVV